MGVSKCRRISAHHLFPLTLCHLKFSEIVGLFQCYFETAQRVERCHFLRESEFLCVVTSAFTHPHCIGTISTLDSICRDWIWGTEFSDSHTSRLNSHKFHPDRIRKAVLS